MCVFYPITSVISSQFLFMGHYRLFLRIPILCPLNGIFNSWRPWEPDFLFLLAFAHGGLCSSMLCNSGLWSHVCLNLISCSLLVLKFPKPIRDSILIPNACSYESQGIFLLSNTLNLCQDVPISLCFLFAGGQPFSSLLFTGGEQFMGNFNFKSLPFASSRPCFLSSGSH